MDVKVITIDFWGTLFSHVGSPTYRKIIRLQLYKDHLQSIGFADKKVISETFFEKVEVDIKSSWLRGICPTRESIINNVYLKYKSEVPKNILENLLDYTYAIYSNELLPELMPGVKEFVKYIVSRWPLYIISDTFTLFGCVLDQVLLKYDLLNFFSGQFYSDQIGKAKPDPVSICSIIKKERITRENIIHIGDLIETDGELAKNAGCKSIIVNPIIDTDEKLFTEEDHIIGRFKNLSSVKMFLDSNY